MKTMKKLVTLVLALVLSVSLGASALAASFPDVTDAATARNAEVLRLMGVMQGDKTGAFKPEASLTRAQFCKMSVVLMGKREEAGRYAARTIFPDVRASHWAAAYVNFAAASESKFIHGMPDGTFGPNREITFGQAVTILLRLLGYTDADAGAVWPDGYLALAESTGLSAGLSLSGSSVISRRQAAQLFVSALNTRTINGVRFADTLGTLTEETVLVSVDGDTGRMVTRDAPQGYAMAWTVGDSLLVGARGRVLLDENGRALTFLPTESESGSPVTDAAIILGANGDTAALDALSGGRAVSAVYRNGAKVEASELRKYDVVGYSLLDNAIHACDLRIAVYYEDCMPSPSAPTVIEALGGTRFEVLSSAQQSLSAFKPGDQMILQLTADGRVAGAVSANGTPGENAVAFVDAAGQTSLICAGTLLPLALEGADLSEYAGQAVSLKQLKPVANGEAKYRIEILKGGVAAALHASEKRLGSYAIRDNALIFDHGVLTPLRLLQGDYDAAQVTYARVGADGKVDLIVLDTSSLDGVYYGIGSVSVEDSDDPWLGELRILTVDCGERQVSLQSALTIRNGEPLRVEVRKGTYQSVEPMTVYANVPAASWIGAGAVMANGVTWTVPSNVPCYNRDTGRWMTGLRAARDYDGSVDLCVADGAVRLILVGG